MDVQKELLKLARDNFDVFLMLSLSQKYGKAFLGIPKHQEFICEKLKEYNRKVLNRESPRLILAIPPRHGKSETTTINFPVWAIGNSPIKRKFGLVTYGANLSDKLGSDARDVVTGSVYNAIFPEIFLRDDTKSKTDWKVNKGSKEEKTAAIKDWGHYFSTTINSSLTGMGFTDLIIDDPYKDRAEAESSTIQESVWSWYQSTALSRMEDGGGIILIMQRWNDNDLVQRILDKEKELKESGEKYDEWEVINLQAIIETTEDEKNDPLKRKIGQVLWEEKYNAEYIETLKRASTPYYFSSQFQQKPVSDEAQVFKKDSIKYYNTEFQFDKTYTALDPAVSTKKEADRSAIVSIGVKGNEVYVLETTANQFNSNEVLNHLFRHQRQYNSEVIVEIVASQKLWKKLIDDKMMETKQYFKVIEFRSHVNKENRIITTLTPFLSNERIFFRGNHTDLINEITSFPRGRRDDIVDSLCMALSNVDFKKKSAVKFIQKGSPFYGMGLDY